MKKLDSLNAEPDKPDKKIKSDMISFVVFNCASLQFIPTTLIALRSAAGSEDVFEILPVVWLCSAATTVFAVVITKILLRITQKRG